LRPEISPETCKPEEVNRRETVLDRFINDLALSEPLDQEAAVIDFSACYPRELSSLVWFVMSSGPTPTGAAPVTRPAE
jgi:hypothetical protein